MSNDGMFLDYERELRASFELLELQLQWMRRHNALPDAADRKNAEKAFKNSQITISSMRMRLKEDALTREMWEPKLDHFAETRKKLKREYTDLFAKIERLQLFLNTDGASASNYVQLAGAAPGASENSIENGANNGVNVALQDRMSARNRELVRGHEMLETSVRQLNESEDTATQIMGDLSQQREVIQRISGNVAAVGAELTSALGTVASMMRRNKKNKVISVVVISCIVISLLLLSFFNSSTGGMLAFALIGVAILVFARCAGVFSDMQLGLLMPTSWQGANRVVEDMELGPGGAGDYNPGFGTRAAGGIARMATGLLSRGAGAAAAAGLGGALE